jgi:hypothetical protein
MFFFLAGFFDFENFASFIVTALGAGAMRHLFLVTVWALGQAVGFQCIVGASGGRAFLGVSAFWIRHLKFLSIKLSALSYQLSANSSRTGMRTAIVPRIRSLTSGRMRHYYEAHFC